MQKKFLSSVTSLHDKILMGFFPKKLPPLPMDPELFSFYSMLLEAQEEASSALVDPLTELFIGELFSQKSFSEKLFIMLMSSGGALKNFSCSTAEELLSLCCSYRTKPINLYFSPVRYASHGKNFWRLNECTNFSQCFFLDIDDISVDFSTYSEEEIKLFLCENYSLPPELLPSWVLRSGHGLHLYYMLTEPINLRTPEGSTTFKKFTDSLIFYYKADISCRNLSRILRFPLSYNAKFTSDLRKTALYHTNSKKFSLTELEHFLCSEEAFESYRVEAQAQKNAKVKATREANLVLSFSEGFDCKPKKFSAQKEVKKVSSTTPLRKKNTSSTFYVSGSMDLSPLPSEARYLKLLRDLENFVKFFHGVPVGTRANFTLVYASICKRAGRSQGRCENQLFLYFDEFFPEAQRVIAQVYASTTTYMYSNATIAQTLGFSDEFLKHTFSCYTPEQVAQAKATRNKKFYCPSTQFELSKELTAKRNLKICFSEKSSKELASELGLSLRTVQAIRTKYKLEKKAQEARLAKLEADKLFSEAYQKAWEARPEYKAFVEKQAYENFFSDF